MTEKEKECLFDILAGDNTFFDWVNETVSYLTCRARMNVHRNYKIYSIRTNGNIGKEDLENIFNTELQMAVEFVQIHGKLLF